MSVFGEFYRPSDRRAREPYPNSALWLRRWAAQVNGRRQRRSSLPGSAHTVSGNARPSSARPGKLAHGTCGASRPRSRPRPRATSGAASKARPDRPAAGKTRLARGTAARARRRATRVPCPSALAGKAHTSGDASQPSPGRTFCQNHTHREAFQGSEPSAIASMENPMPTTTRATQGAEGRTR